MKGSRFFLLATALMVAAAGTPAAAETAGQGSVCKTALSAVGVSSHTEGGRDFERYKGQVPPGLARKRAIDNWELQVAHVCPRHSPHWWRSAGQRIECEGTTGREYCKATSLPARKFLSFLTPG